MDQSTVVLNWIALAIASVGAAVLIYYLVQQRGQSWYMARRQNRALWIGLFLSSLGLTIIVNSALALAPSGIFVFARVLYWLVTAIIGILAAWELFGQRIRDRLELWLNAIIDA